jgi:hypothetical protein
MNRSIAVLFFLGALGSLIAGCSHKYGIYKSYAFFRKDIAGIVRVDDNNRALNSGASKEYLIYLETALKKGSPIIESVWVDGESFDALPVEVKGGRISLGNLRSEEKEVTIKAKPGNQLWQIVLSPSKKTASLQNTHNLTGMIILNGVWAEKQFKYKIKKQQQLAAVYRP